MLQHGLLDNGRSWLINKDEDSLALQLADAGYDVWMMNSRGTIDSNEHVDPHKNSVYKVKSDFWKFSWDSMAEYDVPANLKFILSRSKFDKVHYVGHSQGCT